MSSQKGNVKKTGAPKHANRFGFKNSLHDCSKKTKTMNTMTVYGVCQRCKDIIDWKIKYKKYKPLTVSKKCTKCQQKTVKRAYYIMCDPCGEKHKVCAKCGKEEEIVAQNDLSETEQAAHQSRLEQELKLLTERQRRRFQRLQESGQFSEDEILLKLREIQDGATEDVEHSDSEQEGPDDENIDDELEPDKDIRQNKLSQTLKNVKFDDKIEQETN